MPPGSDAAHAPARIPLAPRFSPGQTFRYEMEFETTTGTSRSGLAADPQGPSKLVVTWDATIRLDVLPSGPGAPKAMRIRTTYEKSAAHVESDTFDPEAERVRNQYQKLEGKSVEFALGADGKITSVSGLEAIVEDQKTLQSAREWMTQLVAGPGAPAGGIRPGQKWSSEQPATSLPIAGMAWRTDSEYLRNEACHPVNPELSPASSSKPAALPETGEPCAVILTHLELIRPKALRDPTPEEYRKNGIRTAGEWTGSAQSLSYVSLRNGLVVSVTQTGTERMDVTLTTRNQNSLRYSGTILSRSQVALVGGGL